MKHALQNLKKLANKENLKAKSAFTLAEVLIVIGVVGVVAAMTIPNLHIKSTGYVNGMACACLAQSDTEYFKKAVREVKLK
jgi:prepilin-type N-terminal cleavage/methylation domain-containing protein